MIAYAGWPLLTASGEALGALCAIDTQPREWSAEDVETLHDLADAAVAELEGRAARILAEQALAREAHTAATLQHALLPGALPVMEGMRIAARYAPAENLIGGDWYDAFRLPGARMGVAIGDVVGHDIDAAATAVQLRSALRGAALEDPAPGRVMGRLNDLAHAGATGGVQLGGVRGAGPGGDDVDVGARRAPRDARAHAVRDHLRGRAGRDPAGVRPAGRAVRAGHARARGQARRSCSTPTDWSSGATAITWSGAEHLRWSVEHGPDDPDALVQTLIERMVKPGAADDVAVVAVRVF